MILFHKQSFSLIFYIIKNIPYIDESFYEYFEPFSIVFHNKLKETNSEKILVKNVK